MPSVKLFSFTKNIDLHAVSASEAITSFMRYERLVRLRRFKLAEFDVDGDDLEAAEKQVESILSRTLDILNPNNEGYRFHTLVSPKTAQNVEVFLVYVSPLFSEHLCLIEMQHGQMRNQMRRGELPDLIQEPFRQSPNE